MTEINVEADRWRFIAKEMKKERDAARADVRHLLQYAPEAVKQTYLELRSWLKE